MGFLPQGSKFENSVPNPLGDVYIFGYYTLGTKGEKDKYYITIKRLLGRTRQTLATSQIIEKDKSNMGNSAMKLAAKIKLVPAYDGSDPFAFWAKHKGLKTHIAFERSRHKATFAKDHKNEVNIINI